MMVNAEKVIYRLLIGSVITAATWTLMTGDFDTVFEITLFVQEDIYDFVRKKRRQARRKNLKIHKAAETDSRERMGA